MPPVFGTMTLFIFMIFPLASTRADPAFPQRLRHQRRCIGNGNRLRTPEGGPAPAPELRRYSRYMLLLCSMFAPICLCPVHMRPARDIETACVTVSTPHGYPADFIYFFEFLRRERGSVDNFNIFRNLGGPGCALSANSSPLRPSGSRTAPSAPGSAPCFVRFHSGRLSDPDVPASARFLQETAVPLNPAVLRNPVEGIYP